MQTENFYKHDGILYAIQFPREWAENHKPETGPKECENCEYFGKWNGAFIGYCANCAQYEYEGKRGIGLITPGIEYYKDDKKGTSIWKTYLKNISLYKIGDKNIENSYELYQEDEPIYEDESQ